MCVCGFSINFLISERVGIVQSTKADLLLLHLKINGSLWGLNTTSGNKNYLISKSKIDSSKQK